MAFETNRFCWHGCVSTDTEVAKTFYASVMGWEVDTVPMGDNDATFFKASDSSLAHLMAPPMEGVPSHWNNYLRVDDVDATLAKAVANGGKEVTPPTDIMPGRFSVVASPSGAMFTLFHEASADSEHHPGGPGGVHWVELHSTNLDADLAWLTSTFGFEMEPMEMPTGPYMILKSNGEPRGGAMNAMMEGAPSMWLTWIEVTDLDATLERVASGGGNALGPVMEVPNVGRMSVIQDPTGGVVGVIKPPASA